MKIKTIVLSCLVSAAVLSIGHEEYGWAKAKAKEKEKAVVSSLKIGVVSVRKIFRDCKRNDRYAQELVAQRTRVEAELNKLSKEIDAEEAGLKTLKVGSDDRLERIKGILGKRGSFEAQREFYKQQIAVKQQRHTEKLYKDILQITHEVAEQKGLDLVFEENEPELPTANYSELMTIISTHKLLYSAGCLDITEEIIARLDAGK